MNLRTLSRLVKVCAALVCLAAGSAHADDYPSKPIRLIVPFGAGGGVDTATRALAEGLQGKLGQAIIVENRTGASGTIAANYVREATPDGYTLLVGTTNLLSFPREVLPGKTYDPLTDFVPVSLIYESPLIVVVNAKSPVQSLDDLIARARQQPGRLNYGSYGVATTSHFCIEELKRRTKTFLTHIPYRGGPTLDLVGNRLDVVCDVVPPVIQHAKAGTLRILAVATGQRTKFVPGAATVAEQGHPGFNVSTWSAIVAPKGTPEAVVRKLNRAVVEVVQSAKFQSLADARSFVGRGSTPQELASFIAEETSRWQTLVTESKIKLN